MAASGDVTVTSGRGGDVMGESPRGESPGDLKLHVYKVPFLCLTFMLFINVSDIFLICFLFLLLNGHVMFRFIFKPALDCSYYTQFLIYPFKFFLFTHMLNILKYR